MQDKTERYFKQTLLWIAGIGLVTSFFYSSHHYEMADIPYVFLYGHGVSLYFQTAVYLIVFTQILRLRPIRNMIEVRNKTNETILKLFRLVLLDWLIFWSCLLIPYCLIHRTKLFQVGDWRLGLLLLVMHMLLMLIVMLIMIAAYSMPYPYLAFVFALLVTLLYHYNLERPILMVKYSIIFDPLYQAIHHIYY
ncbi:hypothetical protein [Lactobacillus sp. PSON]|uniref:hypothetical protein n=1 Tax=Lactobacillus sp. PSON TaxID=3455454 RepID=UPI004043110D